MVCKESLILILVFSHRLVYESRFVHANLRFGRIRIRNTTYRQLDTIQNVSVCPLVHGVFTPSHAQASTMCYNPICAAIQPRLR